MALRTTLFKYLPLSCGVRLLGQLDAGKSQQLSFKQNAEKVVRMIARNRFAEYPRNKYSTVIFSHREGDPYATALLDLIKAKKLGAVVESEPIVNANTMYSTIQSYIWNLNETNLAKFNKPEPTKPRPKYNW